MQLDYHGRSMNREPVNRPFSTIAYQLENPSRRDSVYVQLEPGDGTRYDFTVTRIGPRTFYVSRFVGTDLRETFWVDSYRHDHDDLADRIEFQLNEDRPNPWTVKVLAWWLRELFDEIGAS